MINLKEWIQINIQPTTEAQINRDIRTKFLEEKIRNIDTMGISVKRALKNCPCKTLTTKEELHHSHEKYMVISCPICTCRIGVPMQNYLIVAFNIKLETANELLNKLQPFTNEPIIQRVLTLLEPGTDISKRVAVSNSSETNGCVFNPKCDLCLWCTGSDIMEYIPTNGVHWYRVPLKNGPDSDFYRKIVCSKCNLTRIQFTWNEARKLDGVRDMSEHIEYLTFKIPCPHFLQEKSLTSGGISELTEGNYW